MRKIEKEEVRLLLQTVHNIRVSVNPGRISELDLRNGLWLIELWIGLVKVGHESNSRLFVYTRTWTRYAWNCTFQEQVAYDDPVKKIYHLCIVNLVIG